MSENANSNDKINNNRKKVRILALALGVLLLGTLIYYLWAGNRVSTDDAFIDGRIYPLTPRVAGYVAEVRVKDNRMVKKGEVLVSLDRTEYETAYAEARSELARAEATFVSLDMGVPLELEQTESKVSGAQAEKESLLRNLERLRQEEEAAKHAKSEAEALHTQANLDYRRISELAKNKVVSQSELDKAETAIKKSSADLGSAEAKIKGTRRAIAAMEADLKRVSANIALVRTGKTTADIKAKQAAAQQAAVELARARFNQAKLNLSYTQIVSPADGYVTRKNVEPGQHLAVGQKIMAIVPLSPDEIWVTANYKETQLTNVKVGQTAYVEVDTYPGVQLTGKVESIMSGTGAVFSLFPPENASGNFVKVVQRIPVKIVLDLKDGKHPPLRLGMSVIPTIIAK